MSSIKETKELVKFGIEFGEAFDKSLADGKIDLNDAGHFFSVLGSAKDAFEGIKDLPMELKNMDPAASAELREYVEVELDIRNDKVEEAIEKSLAVVLQVYQLVMFFRALKAPAVVEAPAAAEAPVASESTEAPETSSEPVSE